ncbi:unnamed protein product [Urochloa humidicola]
MASLRTIAAVATAVLLVCALLAWTPEAARMGRLHRGEVAVAPVAGGGVVGSSGNVRYWEQQRGLVVGHRPRLASFTQRDGVAQPNNGMVAGEDGGSKREVPSGPDPIHHGGVAPSSSSADPTTP